MAAIIGHIDLFDSSNEIILIVLFFLSIGLIFVKKYLREEKSKHVKTLKDMVNTELAE